MPNTFVWYDLVTTNLDAAQAFYADVLGWTAESWPGQGPRYVVMKAGERGVAGLTSLTGEMRAAGGRPGWLGYVHVADVDAVTSTIRAAGGAVHREPADIPGVGRFAMAADPQGATFMLLAPDGEDRSPSPPNTPGHIGWHELYAQDWASVFGFYADQFGWTKDESVDMGPMGTYQLFAAGHGAIGGMMNKPDAMPSLPGWRFYVNVDAADAAVARVAAGGGQILMGPMEVPGGQWVVNCSDPQGALFSVVAPRR